MTSCSNGGGMCDEMETFYEESSHIKRPLPEFMGNNLEELVTKIEKFNWIDANISEILQEFINYPSEKSLYKAWFKYEKGKLDDGKDEALAAEIPPYMEMQNICRSELHQASAEFFDSVIYLAGEQVILPYPVVEWFFAIRKAAQKRTVRGFHKIVGSLPVFLIFNYIKFETKEKTLRYIFKMASFYHNNSAGSLEFKPNSQTMRIYRLRKFDRSELNIKEAMTWRNYRNISQDEHFSDKLHRSDIFTIGNVKRYQMKESVNDIEVGETFQSSGRFNLFQ
ncbi:hypothetical protein ACTXT7_004490 [Hymenolepis weldensis]